LKRFVDREEVEEEARVEVEARSSRDKRLQSVCSFDGVARLAVGIAPSVARVYRTGRGSRRTLGGLREGGGQRN
jgi:hypothetical protein